MNREPKYSILQHRRTISGKEHYLIERQDGFRLCDPMFRQNLHARPLRRMAY